MIVTVLSRSSTICATASRPRKKSSADFNTSPCYYALRDPSSRLLSSLLQIVRPHSSLSKFPYTNDGYHHPPKAVNIPLSRSNTSDIFTVANDNNDIRDVKIGVHKFYA